MAFSRAHLFPPEDQATSLYARAWLGHPIRIAIMDYLIKNGPTKVEDLWKKFPLSKPSISQHLKELRDAGLIIFDEVCPFVFYSVNPPALSLAQEALYRIIRPSGEIKNH